MTNYKKIKSLTKSKNLELSFFNFNTKLVFSQLKQVFTETLIFKYFNLEYNIQIETNIYK